MWEDLKSIFEIIASIILINVLFWGILFSIYIHDTNNPKDYVDYNNYIRNTFNNPDFNKNTNAVEDDSNNMTYEPAPEYDIDYYPGKQNPFAPNE